MMYPFAFHAPATLAEARSLFASCADPAYISGGHTLLPAMKNRMAAPSDLIDLSRLPELQGIAREGAWLAIGAATPHAAVAASDLVARTIPALAGLAGSIGDVQVRHRGTMGGSVANNDPAADYPSAVLALDATLVTSSREIAADDWFQGLYATALEPGEVLVRIRFRIPELAGYAKMRNPASRYAMAAAFVARRAGEVRVGVTGAGADGAFRWTEAEAALRRDFAPQALADLSPDPAGMSGDIHADPDYRAHLVAVCTRRAVANPGRLTLL